MFWTYNKPTLTTDRVPEDSMLWRPPELALWLLFRDALLDSLLGLLGLKVVDTGFRAAEHYTMIRIETPAYNSRA